MGKDLCQTATGPAMVDCATYDARLIGSSDGATLGAGDIAAFGQIPVRRLLVA